jgi:uncharacterized protein YcbK (DUF882 family)
MQIRSLLWKVLAVLVLAGPALIVPVDALASGSVSKKKKKRSRGRFVGRGVPAAELRTEALPKPSGRIVVFSRNVHEQADVNIYNEDGSFNQAALARLDRVFRCRRTGEERAMDPRLYEILSILYDRWGKQIEVNSGFRYQRNEGSRHFHASAMDVQIPGVSPGVLYRFATQLDGGGMGIGRYPHNGFVHIDYRAPGEPSYRWTDTHRDGRGSAGKAPSKMWRRSARPNT